MIFNIWLKLALAAVAVVGVGTGGYFAVKAQGLRTLTTALDTHLQSGNYLAALGAAGSLQVKGESTPELEEKIGAVARLLVAEDAFKKAKLAFDEKRFTDAGALLRQSDAITDASFKYFKEAKELYENAEALVAGAAHKTSVTISTLQEKAAAEKIKRETLEKGKVKLEGTIKEKDKKLADTEAQAKETSQKLLQSKREAEALAAQVERETRLKFINELKVYRDMAQKGRQQLENAIVEINGKRDVTALVYVSQGKVLFEETKNKAVDFRSDRTPSAHQSRVDTLVALLGDFLEASKQLRNAVVYIEEPESADFIGSFSKGKSALEKAVSLLSGISDFIAENQ